MPNKAAGLLAFLWMGPAGPIFDAGSWRLSTSVLVNAGLRIGKVGTSSVRYEIGLFGQGETDARAEGSFVHVFVDRTTQRPIPIPAQIRGALERIPAV